MGPRRTTTRWPQVISTLRLLPAVQTHPGVTPRGGEDLRGGGANGTIAPTVYSFIRWPRFALVLCCHHYAAVGGRLRVRPSVFCTSRFLPRFTVEGDLLESVPAGRFTPWTSRPVGSSQGHFERETAVCLRHSIRRSHIVKKNCTVSVFLQ